MAASEGSETSSESFEIICPDDEFGSDSNILEEGNGGGDIEMKRMKDVQRGEGQDDVTFCGPSVVRGHEKKHKLDGQDVPESLHADATNADDSLTTIGLLGVPSSVTADGLKHYFQASPDGGRIKCIQMLAPGRAYITFYEKETAERALKGIFKIHDTVIAVFRPTVIPAIVAEEHDNEKSEQQFIASGRKSSQGASDFEHVPNPIPDSVTPSVDANEDNCGKLACYESLQSLDSLKDQGNDDHEKPALKDFSQDGASAIEVRYESGLKDDEQSEKLGQAGFPVSSITQTKEYQDGDTSVITSITPQSAGNLHTSQNSVPEDENLDLLSAKMNALSITENREKATDNGSNILPSDTKRTEVVIQENLPKTDERVIMDDQMSQDTGQGTFQAKPEAVATESTHHETDVKRKRAESGSGTFTKETKPDLDETFSDAESDDSAKNLDSNWSMIKENATDHLLNRSSVPSNENFAGQPKSGTDDSEDEEEQGLPSGHNIGSEDEFFGDSRKDSVVTFPESLDTVEIVGLPAGFNEANVRKLFVDLSSSIKEVAMDTSSGSAVITFSTPADARKVIEKRVIAINKKNTVIVQPYLMPQHRVATAEVQASEGHALGRIIEVKGIPEKYAPDYLTLLFESKKFGTSGDVDDVEFIRSGVAYITFTSAEDAAKFVEKKKISYKDIELLIDWPSCSEDVSVEEELSEEKTSDQRTVLVSGLPEDSQTEQIEVFFECKRRAGGGPIEYIEFSPENHHAVICYCEPADAANVVDHTTLRFRDKKVHVDWHYGTDETAVDTEKSDGAVSADTIKVTGFTGDEQKDVILLFFEHKQRSGGGEVNHFEFFKDSGTAFITFENPQDAAGVVESYKEGRLMFNTCDLKVFIVDSPMTSSTFSSQSLAVAVSNLNPNTANDTLVLFFENERSSGGGSILEVERLTSTTAVITFAECKVAHRVEQCRPQKLDGYFLEIKHLPSRALPSEVPQNVPVLDDACFVSGMSSVTESDDIKAYVRLAYKSANVDEVVFGPTPGTAMVHFKKSLDMAKLCSLSFLRPLRGSMITVERVEVTYSVQVCKVTPRVRDHLSMYLEKQLKWSGPNQMTTEGFPEKEYVIVTFKDHQPVKALCGKKHVLCGETLLMRPYYDCLGVIPPGHETSVPTLSKFPQPLSVDWENKTGLEFLLQAQKLKNAIEGKLRVNHCDVKWPEQLDFHIMLHCKLDASLWKFHELCEKWEDEVFDCLQEELANIKSHDICTIDQMYSKFKERVSSFLKQNSIDYEKALVTMDDDNSIIRVAGEKKMVNQLTEKLESMLKQVEDELKPASGKVTDVVKNLKPWELTLCRNAKYSETMQSTYPGVKIRGNRHDLELHGTMTEVKAAKKELDTLMSSVVSVKVKFGEMAREVLRQKNARKFIMKKLPDNVNVDWYCSDQSFVSVFAVNHDDLAHCKDVLMKNVKEASVPLGQGTQYLFSTNKWIELVQMTSGLSMEGKCSVRVRPDYSHIDMAATTDVFPIVYGKVEHFVKSNTLVDNFLKMTMGIAGLLNKGLQKKLVKICEEHSAYGITTVVVLNPNMTGVLIRGTKDGIHKAVSAVQTLVASISSNHFNISQPGMPKFFCTKQGQHFLDQVERKREVNIEIEDDSKLKMLKLADSRFSAFLPNGTKVTALLCDITKLQTGAIVNVSNSNMKHKKGLAKAIVNAGGKIIQDECYKEVKKNGGFVKPGVVVITQSGRLKCSMIIHAVGSTWRGGKHNEERVLQELVISTLRTAEQYGIEQISLPAIGTGIFKFPPKLAARNIVAGVVRYFRDMPRSCMKEVSLVGSKADTVERFREVLYSEFPSSTVTHRASPGAMQQGDEKRADKRSGQPAKSQTRSFVTPEGISFEYMPGSLAQTKCDVVVNSSNNKLNLNVGYISKSLLQAAGADLQKECDSKKIKNGQVAVTDSYKLPCKNVFHVACVKWGDPAAEKVLTSSISSCLKMADQMGMKSIAFPALGTGGLGTPVTVFSSLLVKLLVQHSCARERGTLTKVVVVLPPQDTDLKDALSREIGQYLEHMRKKDQGSSPQFLPRGSSEEEDDIKPSIGEKQTVAANIGMMRVEIVHGDITDETTDAVVNSTNDQLGLQGAVGRALVKKAGSRFTTECHKIKKPVSQLVVTGAGNLKCLKVLHLVAPGDRSKWVNSIEACLKMADYMKLSSISFPALGTGILSVTSEEMASIMLRSIHSFVEEHKLLYLQNIRIVIYNRNMMMQFTQVLTAFVKRQGQSRNLAVELESSSAASSAALMNIPPPPARRPPPLLRTPTSKKLVFQIYAQNTSNIAAALQDIHSMCCRQSDDVLVADYRDQTAIAQLTKPQLKYLDSQAEKLDVKITVQKDGPTRFIQIRGHKDDVARMREIVLKVLHSVIEQVRAWMIRKTCGGGQVMFK